jgi:DNA-binding transcriptional LysR family regulator
VAAVGQGLAGSVRIAVSPAVGPVVREEVALALRASAPELAVDFREVRPGELAQLLRDHKLELAVARTAPSAPELDSAALTPTPAILLVPADHRLAEQGPVALADLDGEQLLVWSRPGTPYTDLLRRVAAGGAHVELVQAPVTGGGELAAVAQTGAVALMPAGWPVGDDAVAVELSERVDLPLLVIWLAGGASPAVRRLRAALAGSG